MPEMTATIPHQLSRAEAKRRIQEQWATVRPQLVSHVTVLAESWHGDELKFSYQALGQPVSGRLTVDDVAVHVTVDLPWVLSMLMNTVKAQLTQRVRVLLQ